MKKSQSVREFMTRLPVEAEKCETVADAWVVMHDHHIRHLPVMNGSHLVGIVSIRDILESQLQSGLAMDQISLSTACSTDVLHVGPMDSVSEVAAKMLQRHVGSAVVMDGGYVVGIFTTTDALRFVAAS